MANREIKYTVVLVDFDYQPVIYYLEARGPRTAVAHAKDLARIEGDRIGNRMIAGCVLVTLGWHYESRIL